MDFKALNTFIMVAELNNFTKAGEKLGYSQPTVSFQIKQLEDELGVQLFERIGHTITLTENGHKVLKYAQKICRIKQEMLEGTEDVKENATIRVAMADSLCLPIIINQFKKFTTAHPNISLNIKTAGTDELFRLLDHNQVDIVCTLDNHIYDTTYIIPNEEKIGVNFVCAKNNLILDKKNVSVNELILQPFILTEKGMSYRRLLDQFMATKGIEIKPILEIGSADQICKLVEKDVGVAFLPDYVTEKSIAKGKIDKIKLENFNIELWKQIIYHKDKWITVEMQTVIDFLSNIKLA